jgi:hypothetical protein
MRAVLYPFTIYLGVLEAANSSQGNAELLTVAAALASLTVLVYRLGVWRQEMLNLKNNVGTEVGRYREEAAGRFTRIEQRLATIERFMGLESKHRIATDRWQTRVDRKLEAIDAAIAELRATGSSHASQTGGDT